MRVDARAGVVLCTLKIRQSDLVKSKLNIGATDFLSKPYGRERLCSASCMSITRNRHLSIRKSLAVAPANAPHTPAAQRAAPIIHEDDVVFLTGNRTVLLGSIAS